MVSDMTIDAAQQQLGDLGFEIHVDIDTGEMVADKTCGRHYAIVKVTYGHTSQLVTQWWQPPGDVPRQQTCQYWPDSIAATVECATAVAGAITRSHEADQVPAIIFDTVKAEVTGRHRRPEADEQPPVEVDEDAEPAEGVPA